MMKILGQTADDLKLIAAWLFVGIPLLWGTATTCMNALQLFR